MTSGKDFFSMTKRERRGTIVVLAVIVALLVLAYAIKHSGPAAPDAVQATEMLKFESQVDSADATTVEHQPRARHHGDGQKKGKPEKKHKRHKSKPKNHPAKQPRGVDPLPQF